MRAEQGALHRHKHPDPANAPSMPTRTAELLNIRGSPRLLRRVPPAPAVGMNVVVVNWASSARGTEWQV